jgi:hypothetical protein
MIGLSLLTSGCQLAWDSTRNLIFETCLCTDTISSKIHYRFSANEAWKEYSSAHPEQTASVDFVKGFKAGYADYLENGGAVCAPPAPPLKYWKIKYQNAEGRAATAQWSAGFREGAGAAKASGARNFIVLPINKCEPSPSSAPGGSGPACGATPPKPGVPIPPEGPILPSQEPEKELPLPRPAPKEAAPAGNMSGAANADEPQARQPQVVPCTEIVSTGAPLAAPGFYSPNSSEAVQNLEPESTAVPIAPVETCPTQGSSPNSP